jgi:UDP-N-acetylmuramoyl-L-alanyl-D-glutamate--2,6-diaminopimelate ligase
LAETGRVDNVSGNMPPVIRPEFVSPRSVELLADELGLTIVGNARGVEVTGLTVMTREVRPGDMFVAIRGAARHGAEFVSEAVANG